MDDNIVRLRFVTHPDGSRKPIVQENNAWSSPALVTSDPDYAQHVLNCLKSGVWPPPPSVPE